MNLLLLFPGFIVAFILIFCYEYRIKQIKNKPRNRVHFYVARDKNGSLWIYIGKPIRCDTVFTGQTSVCLISPDFQYFGLNKNDYTNLKWEDEPIEVFVNIKD